MTNLTITEPSGFVHGLVNTIGNSVPFDDFKHFDEKTRETLRKQKKEDEKIVRARYLNSKGNGERLERPYAKYSGQALTMWCFIHDHVYSVPKGLVDEVNEQPKLPQRSEILDAKGNPTIKDGAGEKIHRFIPEGF